MTSSCLCSTRPTQLGVRCGLPVSRNISGNPTSVESCGLSGEGGGREGEGEGGESERRAKREREVRQIMGEKCMKEKE